MSPVCCGDFAGHFGPTRLPRWAREGATTAWQTSDDRLPTWAEAQAQIEKRANMLPLRRPGPKGTPIISDDLLWTIRNVHAVVDNVGQGPSHDIFDERVSSEALSLIRDALLTERPLLD